MSIIANSFKKNAGLKYAKSIGMEDPEVANKIADAWCKGFDLAEQMFVEQN